MRVITGIAALLVAGVSATAGAQPSLPSAQVARIDSVFSRFSRPDGAGCAVGVSRRDTIVFERAYGSAQLEFNVPITPTTIFEAGSVSKQFTAAAVLLLAQRGRLSLDEDVRKHVPELPAYDQPVTIRHLIHHTSGLRDWGVVSNIAGWPRGTRTYTHAHVLDILSRQRALNYPVGAEYLYSNSNYNLLAIIAERVSGMSLAEFTRRELFEPLGMTRTGWRDDYTRVVPGRAQAYSPAGSGWRLTMPNENVYGNSSLLTTVGDLLRWNANFAHQRVGGAEFVRAQERRGRLTSGREIRYAAGLFVDEFAGTRVVSHDGATAGYRAFLARYPDAGFSVALLCNAANADPTGLGTQVASIVLRRIPNPRALPSDTVGKIHPPERLARLAGRYKSVVADDALNFVVRDGRLRLADGAALIALDDQHFITTSGRTHLRFEPATGAVIRIRTWADDSDTTDYVPAGDPAAPSALHEYAGTYVSDEADVTLSVIVENDRLLLLGRPSTRFLMTPIYRDGFSAQGSYIKFTRGSDGKVTGFLVTSGRARNISFTRR